MPALVGGGLVFAGITDWCGMGMLLAKMPWNQTAARPVKEVVHVNNQYTDALRGAL